MKFAETDNHAKPFNEAEITIDYSERYAEILEVYRTDKNGPGFVVFTSIKAIEPQSDKKQSTNEDLRRLEP